MKSNFDNVLIELHDGPLGDTSLVKQQPIKYES